MDPPTPRTRPQNFLWALLTLLACVLGLLTFSIAPAGQSYAPLKEAAGTEADAASQLKGLQISSACSCCNGGGVGGSNPGVMTPLSSVVVARSGYGDLGGSLSASTQELVGAVEKLQCCNVTTNDRITGEFTCEGGGQGASESCGGDRVAFFRRGESLTRSYSFSWGSSLRSVVARRSPSPRSRPECMNDPWSDICSFAEFVR